MSAIKITAADRYFSLCVRKRAGWACERCGTGYGGPSSGLHCSHYHGRGKHATRHDPRNCASLCFGCHRHLGSQPYEHAEFFKARLGEYGVHALWERAGDMTIARQIKRELKEVAKHYKAEFERMETGGTFEGYM